MLERCQVLSPRSRVCWSKRTPFSLLFVELCIPRIKDQVVLVIFGVLVKQVDVLFSRFAAAEFGVVERLARHAGSAVTRDDLSHAVCGRAASPFDRAIDVHVSRLRAKLGPHGPRIVAVRGVGYLLAAPVEAEPSGSPTAGRSRVHHGS